MGPFEILEKIGPTAYHITMPLILHCMHVVFHVLVLCKHVQGPYNIINWTHFQVTYEGVLKADLVCILDHHT